MTGEQILERAEGRQYRDCWGPWRYQEPTSVLEYVPQDRHWWYEIDLERCHTSAQVLDWVLQVCVPGNVSAEDILYLFEALEDLLEPELLELLEQTLRGGIANLEKRASAEPQPVSDCGNAEAMEAK